MANTQANRFDIGQATDDDFSKNESADLLLKMKNKLEQHTNSGEISLALKSEGGVSIIDELKKSRFGIELLNYVQQSQKKVFQFKLLSGWGKTFLSQNIHEELKQNKNSYNQKKSILINMKQIQYKNINEFKKNFLDLIINKLNPKQQAQKIQHTQDQQIPYFSSFLSETKQKEKFIIIDDFDIPILQNITKKNFNLARQIKKFCAKFLKTVCQSEKCYVFMFCSWQVCQQQQIDNSNFEHIDTTNKKFNKYFGFSQQQIELAFLKTNLSKQNKKLVLDYVLNRFGGYVNIENNDLKNQRSLIKYNPKNFLLYFSKCQNQQFITKNIECFSCQFCEKVFKFVFKNEIFLQSSHFIETFVMLIQSERERLKSNIALRKFRFSKIKNLIQIIRELSQAKTYDFLAVQLFLSFFLVSGGYLTGSLITKQYFVGYVPNQSVRQCLSKYIKSWRIQPNTNLINDNFDITNMQSTQNQLIKLINSIKHRLPSLNQRNIQFMIAFRTISERVSTHYAQCEQNCNHGGRLDLAYYPVNDLSDNAVIHELKVCRNFASFENLCKQAEEQMYLQRYYQWAVEKKKKSKYGQKMEGAFLRWIVLWWNFIKQKNEQKQDIYDQYQPNNSIKFQIKCFERYHTFDQIALIDKFFQNIRVKNICEQLIKQQKSELIYKFLGYQNFGGLVDFINKSDNKQIQKLIQIFQQSYRKQIVKDLQFNYHELIREDENIWILYCYFNQNQRMKKRKIEELFDIQAEEIIQILRLKGKNPKINEAVKIWRILQDAKYDPKYFLQMPIGLQKIQKKN